MKTPEQRAIEHVEISTGRPVVMKNNIIQDIEQANLFLEALDEERRFQEKCNRYRAMRQSVSSKSLERQREAINKYRSGL